jgi:integrase
MVNDIHGYGKRLASVMERLESDKNLNKENKLDLLRFKKRLEAEGISDGRIFKYLWTLRNISTWLKKSFRNTTKENIVDLVSKIEKMDYSTSTKHDYQVSLKRFYRFLFDMEKGEYPDQVKWIKLTLKKRDQKIPEELLTEDEIKKMVSYADNARDRALVLLLYESGCRVGEVLTLRIKHVTFDDYGAKLIVEGKTGMRPVRIISFEPEIRQWLNTHPFADNPEAFLWVSLGDKNKFSQGPICYTAVNHILKEMAKRAGVKKRIYPHLFRHTRATHLASKLTEQQLKKVMGWTQDSRVASTYVHLSMRDVDDAILQASGIEVIENKKSKFSVRICPRCNTRNSAIAKYCQNCSFILDAELAFREEQRKEGLLNNLMEMMNRFEKRDPKAKREFEEIWDEMKLEKYGKV